MSSARIGLAAVLVLCTAVGLYLHSRGQVRQPQPSAVEPQKRFVLTNAEQFLEIVDDPLSTPVQRAQAATALGAMGPSALPQIKGFLKHPSAIVRRYAVRAAKEMRTPLPELLPELIVLMGDADRATAMLAIDVSALSGRNDRAVAKAVDNAVSQATDEPVRLHALQRLGGLANPNLNTLRTGIVSPELAVRTAAAQAMLDMGEGALPLMPEIVLSREGEPVVIKLGLKAVEPLAELARHTDPQVRHRALELLAQLTRQPEEMRVMSTTPGIPPPPRRAPQPVPQALAAFRRLTLEYLKWGEEIAGDMKAMETFQVALTRVGPFDASCANACLDSPHASVRYVGAIVRFRFVKDDKRAAALVRAGLADAEPHWRRVCIRAVEWRCVIDKDESLAEELLPAVETLVNDPDQETRDRAQWVVKSLRKASVQTQ